MSQDQLKFAVLEYLKGLKTEGGADGQALDTALTALRWVQRVGEGLLRLCAMWSCLLVRLCVRCQAL